MNLTYKAEWINKTYMYLNVNIGSEKKEDRLWFDHWKHEKIIWTYLGTIDNAE